MQVTEGENMKIKIRELINKIINYEDVPYQVKYNDDLYKWCRDFGNWCALRQRQRDDIFRLCQYTESLEIVEEQRRRENERLKNFINDIISTLARTQLNGTNKLDIVSNYIKSEYEKLLGGDNNEKI